MCWIETVFSPKHQTQLVIWLIFGASSEAKEEQLKSKA